TILRIYENANIKMSTEPSHAIAIGKLMTRVDEPPGRVDTDLRSPVQHFDSIGVFFLTSAIVIISWYCLAAEVGD
ncbi:MAG: hypothetical protein OXI30_20670, partial [Chloroflexota bacterium]|nr:hypothetical protein [Chloroflexota bacterium]